MEEILQKAKELGMMIADSKEFINLKAAEDKQLSDPDAQNLMIEYAQKRDELTARASKDGVTKEDFESIKLESQKAFKKICENENIKAYLEANRKFSSLIEQVNQIIGYFVKGGEASGCSGNCSGCSGCH